MLDLSKKKCVPCNAKDLRPMTEEAAKDLIMQVCGQMSCLTLDAYIRVLSIVFVRSLGGWMEPNH